MRPRPWRRLLVVAVASALGALIAVIPSTWLAAAAASSLTVAPLRMVMAPPAALIGSRVLSPVGASERVSGAVGLRPAHERGLLSFIAAATTPGSPGFHRYLPEGVFAHRFGPSTQAIDAVLAALHGAGLSTTVSRNHLLVDFSGPAENVENAFHTRLAMVRLADGAVRRAAVTPISLPAPLLHDVVVVAGLDDLVREIPHSLRSSESAGGTSVAGSTAPSPAGAPDACGVAAATALGGNGLTDAEIAKAYGAFGLYSHGDTGDGQAVAVFELEPFERSDIEHFDQCYFGSRAAAMMSRLKVVRVDGGVPSGYGSGEAILDIEDISGIAPGAAIDVYEAPNTAFGSLDDYNAIVSSDEDDVITTSWGLCETAMQQGSPGMQQEEDYIFQQAAAQGQSVFAAAGDSGSDDCNTNEIDRPVQPVLSVDDPGSQPYVVSVGGTTVNEASHPPVEEVWNDGVSGGAGGGGVSDSWVMPSWQLAERLPGVDSAGTIKTAEQVAGGDFCGGNKQGAAYGGSIGEPCREVPDVSADADEVTGAITVYSSSFGPGLSGWGTMGGTSSSAPLWAALLALVNASPSCSGEVVDTRRGALHDVGFVSPLLYAVASVPSEYAASFNDIVLGANDIFGLKGQRLYASTVGYDMASGLGSPDLATPGGGDGLAYYLCTLGRTNLLRPAVTSLEPSVLATSSPLSLLEVSGANFEVGGKPAVRSVRIGNYLVPAHDISVTSDSTLAISGVPEGKDLLPTDGAGDGAGAALVTVTLKDGESSGVAPGDLLQVVDESDSGNGAVPAVTGVSSYGGPDAGGNRVTIFGSGFGSGVTSVTFGGVAAVSFSVRNSYEITATVPAYEAGRTTCLTGLSPSRDECQTTVSVTNALGTSEPSRIRTPYEGALDYDGNGVIVPPKGCGCEITPALSEYDYFPPPTITRISTSGGPQHYASEDGGSTVTVSGTGLNFLGLTGLFFGPPSRYSSLNYYDISYDTATRIEVLSPPEPFTRAAASLAVTVETIGGTSRSVRATYAGRPSVSQVTPRVAPDDARSLVTVTGSGLSDVTSVEFVDEGSSSPLSTASHFRRRGSRSLSFVNPEQFPAILEVEACTATSCSAPLRSDMMTVFAPGNPEVSSASPDRGPARGGTTVSVVGENLGCVTAVFFGREESLANGNESVRLGCGPTSTILAVAPPGRPGETVSITLETVESMATGSGRSRPVRRATFTYLQSSPSAPRITHLEKESDWVVVRWVPPSTDGGSPIVSYLVRATAGDDPGRSLRVGPGVRECRLSRLYWGMSWTVSVTAYNRFGAGTAATAIAASQ